MKHSKSALTRGFLLNSGEGKQRSAFEWLKGNIISKKPIMKIKYLIEMILLKFM